MKLFLATSSNINLTMNIKLDHYLTVFSGWVWTKTTVVRVEKNRLFRETTQRPFSSFSFVVLQALDFQLTTTV